MNGHIISGIPVCVDYWSNTPGEKYLHFLSHLHADHTFNLTSKFSEMIYTSPFNAWLVKRWFKIDPELVVILSVGEPHIILHESTQTYISVTLIDANHCPGSVMFLFQGAFGNILYTGDFRYNADMLKHPLLKSAIDSEEVHRLYLDNTFAAEHCDFPPRQQVLQDVLNLIRKHPDHHIIVGVRKLGKEELLRAIALEFKEKICVPKERMEILSFLKYPEHFFTTDGTKARIWAKQIQHINRNFIQKLQKEKGPVLTILLTALYNIVPPNASCNPKLKDIIGVHHIPYSDHSCHYELVKFVSQVKPHTIHPIVNLEIENNLDIGDDEQDPSELFDLLRLHCTPWCVSVIPQSILKFSRNPKDIAVSGCKVSMIGSKETLTNKNINLIEISEDEAVDSFDVPVPNFVATKTQSVLLEEDISEECIPHTEDKICYIPKLKTNYTCTTDSTIGTSKASPIINCKESCQVNSALNNSPVISSENIREMFSNNGLNESNIKQGNVGTVKAIAKISPIPRTPKPTSELNIQSFSDFIETSVLGQNVEIVNQEQYIDQQINIQDPNTSLGNTDSIFPIGIQYNYSENIGNILANESLPDQNTCPEETFQGGELIENHIHRRPVNGIYAKSTTFYKNFDFSYKSWKKSVGSQRKERILQRQPELPGGRKPLTGYDWKSIFASFEANSNGRNRDEFQ